MISEFYRFCRITESRAKNYLGLKNVFEEEFRANPAASFAQCLPKNSLKSRMSEIPVFSWKVCRYPKLKSNKIECVLNHSLILDPNFRADLNYMVTEFEKMNTELNNELSGRFREYVQVGCPLRKGEIKNL